MVIQFSGRSVVGGGGNLLLLLLFLFSSYYTARAGGIIIINTASVDVGYGTAVSGDLNLTSTLQRVFFGVLPTASVFSIFTLMSTAIVFDGRAFDFDTPVAIVFAQTRYQLLPLIVDHLPGKDALSETTRIGINCNVKIIEMRRRRKIGVV